MIAIKTQEDEIVFNSKYLYAIQRGQEYAVIAEVGHRKAYTLGLYQTFERANEEVDNIFKAIESGKLVYEMSEGDKNV